MKKTRDSSKNSVKRSSESEALHVMESVMSFFRKTTPSGKIARDRLKVVLIHDRANVSPQLMENLKNDIIRVISNYMEIDQQDMDIALEQDADSVALIANIPVNCVKHGK